ncbi:MAG: hypothetical protein ACOYMB_00150 [Patescibacteria group bacterium]
MTKEELNTLAAKIKAGEATKEEVTAFHKELNNLLMEINGLLKE